MRPRVVTSWLAGTLPALPPLGAPRPLAAEPERTCRGLSPSVTTPGSVLTTHVRSEDEKRDLVGEGLVSVSDLGLLYWFRVLWVPFSYPSIHPPGETVVSHGEVLGAVLVELGDSRPPGALLRPNTGVEQPGVRRGSQRQQLLAIGGGGRLWFWTLTLNSSPWVQPSGPVSDHVSLVTLSKELAIWTPPFTAHDRAPELTRVSVPGVGLGLDRGAAGLLPSCRAVASRGHMRVQGTQCGGQ